MIGNVALAWKGAAKRGPACPRGESPGRTIGSRTSDEVGHGVWKCNLSGRRHRRQHQIRPRLRRGGMKGATQASFMNDIQSDSMAPKVDTFMDLLRNMGGWDTLSGSLRTKERPLVHQSLPRFPPFPPINPHGEDMEGRARFLLRQPKL